MMAVPQTKHTILLVEDHPQLRRILDRALTSLGYVVVAVENGDAALKMLETNPDPHLVFTDVRMPGQTSGLALADWVRTHRPGVPVLLQTGYADLDTGSHAVLRKPFTDEELFAAIAVALGRRER